MKTEPARPAAAVRAAGLALLVVLAGTGAWAFETLPNHWPARVVPLHVNPNFPTALAGDASRQVEVLRCAADAWHDQSRADWRFDYRGTTAVARVSERDGVNAVFWSNSDGGDALAATLFCCEEAAVSYDIIFFASSNGAPNRWRGTGEPGVGEFDLQGVATHELGHALGLDHTPIAQATMFASAAGRALPMRTLHEDDRAGIEFIYGTRTATPPEVEITDVTPADGPTSGGNEVVLQGVNFTYDSDSQLFIAGSGLPDASWSVTGCGELRIASMPAHATGPVDIRITNTVGAVTLPAAYRYGGPPPRITSIEPPEGPTTGGIPITVVGEHFDPTAVVTLGGLEVLDLEFVSPTVLTGVLPARLSGGPVDVELEQGIDSAVLPGGFTYNPYGLALGQAEGAPGARAVPVPVRTTTPVSLSSVSFGFTYPQSLLAVADVSVLGTIAEDAEFAAADIENGAGVTTFGLVMSFKKATPFVPPGEGIVVANVLADIASEAAPGTEIPLAIQDEVGTPPIQIIFTKVGDTARLRPLTSDGEVTVRPAASFIRGDSNGDRIVNIVDPIYLLANLFQGGPRPPCADAADATDNGGLDISDAIGALVFLFQGGDDLPAPHPEPGPDPTFDDLGCEG